MSRLALRLCAGACQRRSSMLRRAAAITGDSSSNIRACARSRASPAKTCRCCAGVRAGSPTIWTSSSSARRITHSPRVSAAEEQRALVTLDLDFSNLIRLPPTGKGCHPSFRQMTTRGTVVKRTDKRKVAMRNGVRLCKARYTRDGTRETENGDCGNALSGHQYAKGAYHGRDGFCAG